MKTDMILAGVGGQGILSIAAALGSRSAAETYGLDICRHAVQDTANNYTRFACISKNLEIYPGADRSSLSVVVADKPGALYKVLARFYSLDINLVKLESRPIPGKDFEFRFYFDVEASVGSKDTQTVLSQLEKEDFFTFLGAYSEVF